MLLVSRDPEQMFRIADRIVVLRHGEVVGELDPHSSHPDDVAALQSGQRVDSSARRQLTRLHSLADRLVSADPASSLSLILSALGSALSVPAPVHPCRGRRRTGVRGGARLHRVGDLGLVTAGGRRGRRTRRTRGRARRTGRLRRPGRSTTGRAWVGSNASIASAWSTPVLGPSGVSAVITAFSSARGGPGRDQLDLLSLYAGYAAGAVERERLLRQVTARNRVLETTREMLETLAGPVTVADGLLIALHSLCRGLECDEVALVTRGDAGETVWRAYAGPDGTEPQHASTGAGRRRRAGARRAARRDRPSGRLRRRAAGADRPVRRPGRPDGAAGAMGVAGRHRAGDRAGRERGPFAAAGARARGGRASPIRRRRRCGAHVSCSAASCPV